MYHAIPFLNEHGHLIDYLICTFGIFVKVILSQDPAFQNMGKPGFVNKWYKMDIL